MQPLRNPRRRLLPELVDEGRSTRRHELLLLGEDLQRALPLRRQVVPLDLPAARRPRGGDEAAVLEVGEDEVPRVVRDAQVAHGGADGGGRVGGEGFQNEQGLAGGREQGEEGGGQRGDRLVVNDEVVGRADNRPASRFSRKGRAKRGGGELFRRRGGAGSSQHGGASSLLSIHA